MPIQLDKILTDIAQEKVLHPFYPDANKKEVDEAWLRVSKSNKLSVHEARSIFKVLQKKYEQEKVKGSSSWKLFSIMDEIHSKVEIAEGLKDEGDSDGPIDEDEEFEMLEVQEEEETPTTSQRPPANSDGESPSKSSSGGSSETEEKSVTHPAKNMSVNSTKSNGNTHANNEEKKVLNPMASNVQRQGPAAQHKNNSVTAAALHKKGITLKKTAVGSPLQKTVPATVGNKQNVQANTSTVKAIPLPESIKRKLSEEQHTTANKRANLGYGNTPKALQVNQIKSEKTDEQDEETQLPSGINVITIPGSSDTQIMSNGTVVKSETNGYMPGTHIDSIDFGNDIIFDQHNNKPAEVINLGNFDNSLPPTFFKNLCNSSRHEALGLYVANVMNRLDSRSAAKLELKILQSIIDAQNEQLKN